MENVELIEREFSKQLENYAVIKGIKDGDINEESIKRNSLEYLANKELDENIKISGKIFKIYDEEKINELLEKSGSKQRYFYFTENNSFIYGTIDEYSNNIIIVEPAVQTPNIIKNNWYHFKKNNKLYINKETIDNSFDMLVKSYNQSKRIKKALSIIGINSKEGLINSEENIKYNSLLEIFSQNLNNKNPIISFLEDLEKKKS